jgi:CRP/FNR family cyclic AMP-dependent transcriptional regulator
MKKLKPWYYENANLFRVLNEEQIKNIEQISTIKTFKKGHLISSLGDLCDYIYILKKGSIKVFLLTSDGKETILAIRQPGNIIGLTAIFGWPRRVSYVAALSNVEVLKFRTKDIKNIILNNSKLAESIIKILCARLHHSRRVIYDLSTKNVQDRLVRFILDLADDVGVSTDVGILINLELTHEQISQMIATSRQSVTVILNDLESKKIIKKSQKKITIYDPKALLSLMGSPDSI